MTPSAPSSAPDARRPRYERGEGQDVSVLGYKRIRAHFQGVVQGVGFRPFLYRLATELGIAGTVRNTAEGAVLEVEGTDNLLDLFFRRVRAEAPVHSVIQTLETQEIPPVRQETFRIEASQTGEKSAWIPPDLATCSDCLSEIFDPKDRRFRYPFTNCTNCGPRYSILQNLPYDRPNTSMAAFEMCPECREEYRNPLDRRFHAQPNACPECGPQLALWDTAGNLLAEKEAALLAAEEAVRAGKILALKGLGGFHLLVDARNDDTVQLLRTRKHREEKPFAVMFPNQASVRQACRMDWHEEHLLESPQKPIVILRRKASDSWGADACSYEAAPGNPNLGVLLPYTPLHHLLMDDLGFPVVATSGNLSGEPICIDENEALERLRGIADLFLVHNRPILRQMDDSIARVMAGGETILRRARGYAPLPLSLPTRIEPTLAVGAHLKNAIAAGIGDRVFLSQHIGDLETDESFGAFTKTLRTFEQLKDFDPASVVHDLHPDYISTSYAQTSGLPCRGVQHHYAHILACLADRGVAPPVLGIAWDGTGYGADGTIWGGEFLKIRRGGGFNRVGRLRTFPLPGGDAAAREPRRSALGLFYSCPAIERSLWSSLPFYKSFRKEETGVLERMLANRLNTPVTSSMGRLFDAVAAILGLKFVSHFEGQAAMELEFAIGDLVTEEFYPLPIRERDTKDCCVLDWEPTIKAILEDLDRGEPTALVSARFHNGLVDSAVRMAERFGEAKVALSGGCFQNKYLLERTIECLTKAGFEPIWHYQVPPNDGGIALGQIAAAVYEGRA